MVSEKIKANLNGASWIRAMFEEGEKLRSIHGVENVYDFTLGNPDPMAPAKVAETIKKILDEKSPSLHKYMNNAGYVEVREKIAQKVQLEVENSISGKNIIMTCGAAGGLNVVLKTILNPEDEVIVFAPYFVEYMFYIDNHGGKSVVALTNTADFQLDVNELKKKITSRTKAIIINSPNNPTGVIYSEETLKEVAKLLVEKEKEFNSKIFVISDEPYSKLAYDNIKIPNILNIFTNAFIVSSYSKSLSLAGERIGYIVVNNEIEDVELLIGGLVFANRTLGFVNAPALFQKVIAEVLDENVDVNIYKERRDMILNGLTEIGYSCIKPNGAFYLFPKCPIEDDIAFAKHAVKYNLLIVPGTGFGMPGYFRLSYCVSKDTINNSMVAFRKVFEDFK